MPRRALFLPESKSQEMPSNCIWFDTETKHRLDDAGRQHHYLWFGYAAFQRRIPSGKWSEPEWFRFETIAEFWEWVNSKSRPRTRLYLFAHNGGFDLPVMHAFTELPKMGFKLKNAVADAPPLILTWRNDSRTIRFIDTLNIWRTSLEEIGKSIGHNKLTMPAPEAPQSEWDAYGQQDTDIIRRALLAWFDFLTDNDLGGFSATIASQSFNAYRHRFMPCPIFIDNNEKALEVSRASYVGGRTECFKLGTHRGQFYYLDVNSMYPSVMKDNLFPRQLVSVYRDPSDKEIEKWSKEFLLIAECIINTDEPIYPMIFGSKLIFPVGRFHVFLAHPEYMQAVKRGHVEQTIRVACYEPAELFSDFVTEIYTLRQKARKQGNEINAWLYKILLNSLYGKFGQRGRRYETIGECDPNELGVWLEVDADSGNVVNLRKFGGIIQEWVEEDEARYSFPAIAATVTAYARQILWQAIERCGRDNVYYMDTDSIVVNAAGYEAMKPLIDPKQLGAWKLEDTFSEITLYGPKDYIFGDKARTKGVRSNALWLKPNKIEQDRFVGLKGLLREQDLEGPIVHRIEKTLNRDYTKANIKADGSTLPLFVDIV